MLKYGKLSRVVFGNWGFKLVIQAKLINVKLYTCPALAHFIDDPVCDLLHLVDPALCVLSACRMAWKADSSCERRAEDFVIGLVVELADEAGEMCFEVCGRERCMFLGRWLVFCGR